MFLFLVSLLTGHVYWTSKSILADGQSTLDEKEHRKFGTVVRWTKRSDLIMHVHCCVDSRECTHFRPMLEDHNLWRCERHDIYMFLLKLTSWPIQNQQHLLLRNRTTTDPIGAQNVRNIAEQRRLIQECTTHTSIWNRSVHNCPQNQINIVTILFNHIYLSSLTMHNRENIQQRSLRGQQRRREKSRHKKNGRRTRHNQNLSWTPFPPKLPKVIRWKYRESMRHLRTTW